MNSKQKPVATIALLLLIPFTRRVVSVKFILCNALTANEKKKSFQLTIMSNSRIHASNIQRKFDRTLIISNLQNRTGQICKKKRRTFLHSLIPKDDIHTKARVGVSTTIYHLATGTVPNRTGLHNVPAATFERNSFRPSLGHGEEGFGQICNYFSFFFHRQSIDCYQ